MATVTLGGTPLTRIGQGTNRLTHSPENVAFVRDAAAAGVGLIDTAHSYRGGESEQTIGAALSSSRDGCVVATKGGYRSGRPEVLSAEIDESLRRLRTDRIDLYYLHTPDPETPLQESLGVIDEYRERGAIQHIGVSNVSVDEIERARDVAPIAAVQNHYNLCGLAVTNALFAGRAPSLGRGQLPRADRRGVRRPSLLEPADKVAVMTGAGVGINGAVAAKILCPLTAPARLDPFRWRTARS